MANKHSDRSVHTHQNISKKTTIGDPVEKLEFSYIADGNAKWHTQLGKQQFHIKLNINLPKDTAIQLLGSQLCKRNESTPT